MDINNITAVYFVWGRRDRNECLDPLFPFEGKEGGGYDKTPSGLTEQLNYEGAAIHYEDNVDLIPDDFTDPVKDTGRLYSCRSRRPFGALLFPGEWFRGDEACTCVRRDHWLQPRIVCGRYARQDNDLFDGRPPAETVSCGLQCFLRRYPEEL